MGLVISDMSMSLDGYIAGPNAGVDNPLGDGGGAIALRSAGRCSW